MQSENEFNTYVKSLVDLNLLVVNTLMKSMVSPAIEGYAQLAVIASLNVHAGPAFVHSFIRQVQNI
jgi:hypothetical protein